MDHPRAFARERRSYYHRLDRWPILEGAIARRHASLIVVGRNLTGGALIDHNRGERRSEAAEVGARRGRFDAAEPDRAALAEPTASAGCRHWGVGRRLKAFKSFFAKMPPDSGLAFVLVQHLNPDHKSILTDLIARQTTMTVAEAADGMRVASDTVFVIPPDATLTIIEGRLRVERPAPPDKFVIRSTRSSRRWAKARARMPSASSSPERAAAGPSGYGR